jgi:N-dimethylarginine dimethylaminohydrolase
MKTAIMIELPKKTKDVHGCWSKGYPIHQGLTKDSLNHATVYAHEHNILPNQKQLKKEHSNLKRTIRRLGYKLRTFKFPEELNTLENLEHDFVFIRDSCFIIGKYLIKANFSCKERKIESDFAAEILGKKLRKKILEPKANEYIEFGEVYYLKTINGTYYFGGISRANEAGHNFMKNILNPDNFIILKSRGYHLDTIFSPVVNANNELCAVIYTKNLMSKQAIKKLRSLNVELIPINLCDSIGNENQLGNCAVNSFIRPGVFVSNAYFKTKGVEKKLKALGINHVVCPVSNFLNAGGAVHCLTNEVLRKL